MWVDLQQWDRYAIAWHLNGSTGELARAETPVVCHGFIDFPMVGGALATTRPRFCAMYVQDSTLWFHVDECRWNFATLTLEHGTDDRRICSFRAFKDGSPVLEMYYPSPLVDPLNIDDPAFDELDSELSDFYLYLERNGPDENWRHDIIEAWRVGFPVPPSS